MKDNDIEPKSKTQIKEEMLALQDIGRVLIELPDSVYKTFPISEDLDDAIKTYRRISSHNARKRQMQYIGRVIRGLDVQPLLDAIDNHKNGNRKKNLVFQELEKIRERLIAGEQSAVDEVLKRYPNCQRQKLMQLVRAAQKEAKANQETNAANNTRQFKKLFGFLKELENEAS